MRLSGWLSLCFLTLMPTTAAAGDRAADVHLSYAKKGLVGQIAWGELGIRLDFHYPTAPGEDERATLAIVEKTGDAFLILHGSKEVLVGTWPLSEVPSPLDLIEPALGNRPLEPIGEVELAKQRCLVSENKSRGHLKVWTPVKTPDIPRLARREGTTTTQSAEIAINNVRPARVGMDDLKVPDGYTVHPFTIQELMVRTTTSEAAGELGARMVVWLSANNLERHFEDVHFARLVEREEGKMDALVSED